jgi:LysM repeat protein
LAPTDNLRRTRHIVRRGDTLGGLARRYHVSIANLRKWNRSSLRIIRVGQSLIISQSGSTQPYGLRDISEDRPHNKMAESNTDHNDSKGI